MAERRATNKYYPPDWDPSKGSVNKHVGSNPLRARARKIDKGILVVRFELPFNIWCLRCENHVAMGVRYNAEKSKIGNYYTSPIFQFKMKCHLCDNIFVINTDPSKFDYVIEEGARRQAQASAQDGDDQKPSGSLERVEDAKRRMTDSMYNLERKIEDKANIDASQISLRDIKQWRSRFEDGFSANRIIRAQYRERRKNLELSKERNKSLLKKSSLKIPLVRESPRDRLRAKEILVRSNVDRILRSEAKTKATILKTEKFI